MRFSGALPMARAGRGSGRTRGRESVGVEFQGWIRRTAVRATLFRM